MDQLMKPETVKSFINWKLNLMIEFTAQAEIDAVESVLVEVGSSGIFSIKPDRFIKRTSAYRKFVLLSGGTDRGTSLECGTIELTRKRDSQVSIKINTSSNHSGESPMAVVDRFFYLFTQRLLQQRMVAIEAPRGIGM